MKTTLTDQIDADQVCNENTNSKANLLLKSLYRENISETTYYTGWKCLLAGTCLSCHRLFVPVVLSDMFNHITHGSEILVR